MECLSCKTHYVGKSETLINIHPNNRRSNVADPNAIPACRYFAEKYHSSINMQDLSFLKRLSECLKRIL